LSADLVGKVVVGRIKGLWGNQGAIRVEMLTDSRSLFNPGSKLFLKDTLLTVEWGRWHRGDLVLQLEGLHVRYDSSQISNSELTVLESDLPPLDKDYYYHYQLLGLRVVTESGEELGKLTEIMTTGATDVYVVHGESKRALLLPAISEVVKTVSVKQGFMVVNVLEGLR
jgi:16S rRNA processing protein RimM